MRKAFNVLQEPDEAKVSRPVRKTSLIENNLA